MIISNLINCSTIRKTWFFKLCNGANVNVTLLFMKKVIEEVKILTVS